MAEKLIFEDEADVLLNEVRDETFRWYIRPALDPNHPWNEFPVEQGGTISRQLNARIRSGGSAEMEYVPTTGGDFLVRGEYILNAGQENEWVYPLGRYFYSTTEHVPYMSWTANVDLYDETIALAQDGPDQTYVVSKGTLVTDEVIKIIMMVWPQAKLAITPSPKALRMDRSWEIKHSYLDIINDLLESAGYFSLYVDEEGVFTAEPYVFPKDRPKTWEFIEGVNCLHLPDFKVERDMFSVPNKVVAVPRTDGEAPPLKIELVTNEDPESPFSVQGRGRVVRLVLEDVEATDQDVLRGIAIRSLNERTEVEETLRIRHAYIPHLRVNDKVWFDSEGVSGWYTIGGMTLHCETGMLVDTALRKVQNVD